MGFKGVPHDERCWAVVLPVYGAAECPGDFHGEWWEVVLPVYYAVEIPYPFPRGVLGSRTAGMLYCRDASWSFMKNFLQHFRAHES